MFFFYLLCGFLYNTRFVCAVNEDLVKTGKTHSEKRNWVVRVLQTNNALVTDSRMHSICGIFGSVSAVLLGIIFKSCILVRLVKI